MIVVLDTNIILSGLLRPLGCPGRIYRAMLGRTFELATCEWQLQELREASRKPYFTSRLKPHQLGQVVNAVRSATLLFNVPRRHTALDPTDSFLLDLAAASNAHYLVTGDKKSGLLQLGKLGNTRIVSPASFCTDVLGLEP
jgi:putative PIN family toxin of toxin-antitoxin system